MTNSLHPSAPVQLPPFYREGPASEVRALELPYQIADPQLPRHWQQTGGGDGVVVGVADTGIDAEHPEIAGRVIDAKDFTGSRKGIWDGNDHGTHCATSIAGESVGVAPSAKLLIAKVLADNGSGNNNDVADGIRWLHEKGADIISLSLGSPYDDPDTREAILDAINDGVIVCAATGNEHANHVSYPAQHCVGVGAVDRGMQLAWFSNRGKNVDLVGYGVNIYAGVSGGKYQSMSGTSMATPFVAGLAANRLSAEIKHLGKIVTRGTAELLKLETFVTDLGPAGRDTSYGRGFVDCDKAFYENLEPADKPEPTPPVEPVPTPSPAPIPGEGIWLSGVGAESGAEYPVMLREKT